MDHKKNLPNIPWHYRCRFTNWLIAKPWQYNFKALYKANHLTYGRFRSAWYAFTFPHVHHKNEELKIPHHPVKLDIDKYVLWSTVVDAPISYVMSAEEMHQHLTYAGYWCVKEDYDFDPPNTTYTWDTELKAWVDNHVLNWNRAGPEETCLSAEEIIEQYSQERKP